MWFSRDLVFQILSSSHNPSFSCSNCQLSPLFKQNKNSSVVPRTQAPCLPSKVITACTKLPFSRGFLALQATIRPSTVCSNVGVELKHVTDAKDLRPLLAAFKTNDLEVDFYRGGPSEGNVFYFLDMSMKTKQKCEKTLLGGFTCGSQQFLSKMLGKQNLNPLSTTVSTLPSQRDRAQKTPIA